MKHGYPFVRQLEVLCTRYAELTGLGRAGRHAKLAGAPGAGRRSYKNAEDLTAVPQL